MKLVVVESPAKAKTINKYLGKNFIVEASYGHICDLPSKNGSVVPENDFEMKYEISPRSTAHIKKLTDAVKKSDELILATDPDREGEAISWHVLKVLEDKKALKHSPKISRVAFNEITKNAVNHAIQNPRELDQNLIDAQQARRALDYLVGFNLSPVLWRKLPGAKSAGRVQSVALKLICERELEIEKFISQEYWDITGLFSKKSKEEFSSRLIVSEGEKLNKFSLNNETITNRAVELIKKAGSFCVDKIEKKLQKRNPSPPFTTSTIQQEASRKLGFGAKRTMQVAQKLYEGIDIGSETIGLITYMRTDGVYMAQDAINTARAYITKNWGDKYCPASPKLYKSKSKNAQEAHECIRPTDFMITPDSLKGKIDIDQHKLYELVWKRALASQMESAELELVNAEIANDDKKFVFKANGSSIKFDGFYKLYIEGNDDDSSEDSKLLPTLEKDEVLNLTKIDPKQHFTEPPPRFNEASLVKKLEELGIGRPSTYATIISVIQDRQYVRLEKKRFIPEERGRLVTTFLNEFFQKYVEYDFTAKLEEDLDKIADGDLNWKELLQSFWSGFSDNINNISDVKITEVIEKLENILENHLFPKVEGEGDPRKCPSCKDGKLGLRLSKFGAFLACSNYPECEYKKSIASADSDSSSEPQDGLKVENKVIGDIDGKEVLLKKGPYGYYLEIPEEKIKNKPKRASIPNFVKLEEVDINIAKKLLSLPIYLGKDNTENDISIGIGKYGPYVKCGNKFTSIPKDEDPFSIKLSRALEIIEEGAKIAKHKKGKKDE